MNLKKSQLLILFLILIIPQTWSQSSEIVTESLTECWTDLEVLELVEALKIEKNKAIDEAVKIAVIPLLSELYGLRYGIQQYSKEQEKYFLQIKKIEQDNFFMLICIGVAGIGIGIVVGVIIE